MTGSILAALLAVSLAVSGCDSTGSEPIADPGVTTHIEGNLNFESPTATEGQILLWVGLTEVPADLHPRPVAAVETENGHFELDVRAGQYLVRATTLEGALCGEANITTRTRQSITVDFTCP